MHITQKTKVALDVDRTKTNHLANGGGLILENTKERIASTNKAKEAHRQRDLAINLIKPISLNWVTRNL